MRKGNNRLCGWASVVCGTVMACAVAGVAHAQDSQQTAPPQTAPAQTAKPAQKTPSSTPPAAPAATPAPSDDNAFPQAESEAAQKKAEAAQGDSDSNAFPEAKSEAAQKQANQGGAPPSSNGEAYSSSRSNGMSINDLLGTNDSAVADGAGHYIENPKLAKEDIRVGQFYLAQGNYPGAYMRLKEATEVGPGNVDAVYFLAEAARKTSHLDEAEQNYKLYLEVEPNGKYAKDSLKALKELAGK